MQGIKLILQIIFISLLIKLVAFSNQKPKSKLAGLLSRCVVILVFLIASISLGIYAIYAVEMHPWKRIIAGGFALALLAYLTQLIRGYVKKEG